ncbi:type 1 glutamine amidotransferase [Parvularcula marina]|uniref:type 1 glutamine amidotransferase n=1 Tax=Parvularcula marina TaxID=2292771 RepID=UPI003514E121
MKLVIAETGIPPMDLSATHNHYPDMMVAMLSKAGLDVDAGVARVFSGDQAPAPDEGDALLITGSPAGVYEDLPWIAPLAAAVRDWASSGKPVIGICFGHQLMAHAMGGRVEKSAFGWGVGVHTYELTDAARASGDPARIACVVSHQDQVVSLPEGAERIGGSAFCPNGIIRYGQGRMLSFQMHPEFDHEFAEALLAIRENIIPAERVALARAGFSHHTDRALMGKWIAAFLKGEVE